MPIVVADTSPINYLVLTGDIDLLATLFHRVILPPVVAAELSSPGAPPAVRQWIGSPPEWIEVRAAGEVPPAVTFPELDAGEADAIALALLIRAELILIDDRQGTIAARRSGLAVMGTLGILGLAAQHGLINLNEAFARIRKTNFRYPREVMERLLTENDASGRRLP